MAKKRKSENAGLDEVERTLYTSFCTAANSISQLYTQAHNQQKVAFQAGERHCVVDSSLFVWEGWTGAIKTLKAQTGMPALSDFCIVVERLRLESKEKIYHWLQREHQAGSNISTAEILNHLQNELDGEEMTMSPGTQVFQQQPFLSQQQQQHHQQQHQQQHLLSSNNQVPPGAVGYSGLGNPPGRIGAPVDQTKISIFTGALSSPNRRSLQPLAIVHGGYGSVNHVSLVGNVGRRSSGGADHHVEAAHEERESPTSNPAQPYNSSSVPSHTHSASLGGGYDYIPPLGQHREPHTFGENDSSMDMHADGGSDGYYHHTN